MIDKREQTEFEILEREAAIASINSLYVFVKNFWHVNNQKDKLQDNWHIEYLCNKLTVYGKAIASREYIDDLIINIPPGMSKSTIANHCFQVWMWLLDPSIVVLCSCNSSTLSTEHSIKAKNIFKSERFQRWFQSYFKNRFGKELYLTKDTEIDWINNFGGRRYNTYTNGPVIGIHAHAQIWDDPMSLEMTYSDSAMEKVHKFNDHTLSTRKKNIQTTPTLCIMQRLHENDTTANMLKKQDKGKKIEHICLPYKLSEYVKPYELVDKYVNGRLDPIRLSDEAIAKMKIDLVSEEMFDSQYGQDPGINAGGIFKKEWFEIVEFMDLPDAFFNADTMINLDTASKIKENNDPSGILTYTGVNNDLYLIDWVNKRLEFPELCQETIKVHAKLGTPNTIIYVEPKSSGSSLVQQLRRTTKLNIIEYKMPQGDKMQRAKPCTVYYQAGRVKLVKGDWNGPFLKQLQSFNGITGHDEAVDNITMAVTQELIRGGSKPSTGRSWART